MTHTPLARGGAAACVLLGALAAQKPTPPPVDPQLPEFLKELKGYVANRKMTDDFQAIGLMQKLGKDIDKRNPKDQKKIATALGDVFKRGKLREGAQDVLYREAADVLAKLGEEGAKQLAKYANHKRFADNLGLRAHLIKKTGETEDEKQIDWILEVTVRAHQDELRAAAGEALGNFKQAKLKDRRAIVKDIVRAWGSLHSLATQPVQTDPNAPVDFNPQNARQTLRKCEGPWRSTLQKLTGVSQSNFRDWQRWLNKNPRWK